MPHPDPLPSDAVLVAEREHLVRARSDLARMRARTRELLDTRAAWGNDDLTTRALSASLARRSDQLLDDGVTPLFFGRLDREPAAGGEVFHVGRRHVSGADGEPVVVDWRAPVSGQPSRTVLPCWPAHSGVTEELAALRTAWLMAAEAGRAKTPNDSLIFWHDRWLHPCLSRLREAFQYGTCVDKHKPTRPGRTADLDLLAAALVAAAERSAAGAGPAGPLADPATGELL